MKQKWMYIVGLAVLAIAIALLVAGKGNSKSRRQLTGSADKKEETANGALLFSQYCGTCHLLPAPGHLTKHVWKDQVLPVMAMRMGLPDETYERNISEEEKLIEQEKHLIPEKPMLSKEDFQAITAYIVSQAPDSITIDRSRSTRNAPLMGFMRRDVPLGIPGPSLITALNYHPETKTLWIGNLGKQVFTWKHKQGVTSHMIVTSPAVHFSFYRGSAFITEIGDLLPNEVSRGSFSATNGSDEAALLSPLHRPVFSVLEDFDASGLPEVVVCNFGKNTGSLSIYRKENNSSPFVEQVLLPMPGATKCFIRDMDGDGLKDIVALVAQGDESVYIFFNNGGLKFRAERVLRFPPDYGTTDIVLADFNQDGKPDILTAHGDNADYSIIPKAYHGIRIHINKDNNTFTEEFFYPIYGITKLLAEDFDKDGDMDLATSSFYAEYSLFKDEAFVYLENTDQKNYRFKTYIHQNEVPVKSLTMEAADIDDDGDMDILLGNFAFSPVALPEDLKVRWQKADYGLIIFENRLRNKK